MKTEAGADAKPQAAAAKTEVPYLLWPCISQSSIVNWHSSFRETKSCPAGRTKSMLRMVDILASLGRNLQAAPADDEAPKPFRFRGFMYPGSYLLSRDLSSDYHRRADVSLPGSEWDRVGPSGYDHQVSGSSSLCCSLLTSVIICACGLLLYVLAAGWWAAG